MDEIIKLEHIDLPGIAPGEPATPMLHKPPESLLVIRADQLPRGTPPRPLALSMTTVKAAAHNENVSAHAATTALSV
ncbi:MAG: hypothetical protein M3071_05395 [Actinomycetota bacterium]|nr:hypothetical protein [Actinomycetota bacterium]